MFYLAIQKIEDKCVAFRYIIFIISVCNAFHIFAQQDISRRISDILTSHDTDECKLFMQQIKESDITNMPDSTLFDYYYLAGWHSSENK